MKPRFFKTSAAFREWLHKNHDSAKELSVGYYKVGSGNQNMTWSESVDQALCFGWIDGVRSSIDEDRYQIRFTPRRENSIWSAVNIKKVEALKKVGLMQPAGLAIYEKRKPGKEKLYIHENEEMDFSVAIQKIFKANKPAWKFFQTLPPSYKKLSKNWVMNAKQEATRLKRLQTLINQSENGSNPFRDHQYKKR